LELLSIRALCFEKRTLLELQEQAFGAIRSAVVEPPPRICACWRRYPSWPGGV